MKIMPDAHSDIIEAYTIDLWSLQEIADSLQVSRTAVHKFLNKHGVNTSKRRIKVSCTTCGATIERTKKRVRKQHNHFCDANCYTSFLDAGKTMYKQSRHGQRIARIVVAKFFSLEPDHIVHHEDRNNYNNSPQNLKVFANQGDHLRYHHFKRDQYTNKLTQKTKHRKAWDQYHKFEVAPLWDGSTVPYSL